MFQSCSKFATTRHSLIGSIRGSRMSPLLFVLTTLVITTACNQKTLEQKKSLVTPAATGDDPSDSQSNGGSGNREPPPKPISLIVTPSVTTVASGTSVRLSAIAVYPYGIMKDITDFVTWSVDNAALAEFRSYERANNLSTLEPGTVSVTASYRDITDTEQITISTAKFIGLSASPDEIKLSGLMIDNVYNYQLNNVFTDQLVKYQILGTLSDGRIQDITNDVTHTSTDPKIELPNKGEFKITGPTSASINVKFENLTATLPIEAIQIPTQPRLLTISDAPFPVSEQKENLVVIPNGALATIYSQVTQTDTEIINLSTSTEVTWLVNDPLNQCGATPTPPASLTDRNCALEINSMEDGSVRLKAKRVGHYEIIAKYKDIEQTARVVITPGSLVSIDISPKSQKISVGDSASFTAIGTYSDASTFDLTTAVTWKSENPLLLSFSTTNPKNVLRAVAPPTSAQGTAVVISASFSGVTGVATVTVINRSLKRIEIRPVDVNFSASSPIPVGSKWSQQFQAFGFYSNSTTAELITSVSWSSEAPSGSLGKISVNSSGLVTGTKPGQVALKATSGLNGGVTGTLALTISERTLESLTIIAYKDEMRSTPMTITENELTSPVGRPVWFSVLAAYSDGATNEDVTKDASWTFEYDRPSYSYHAYVLDSAAESGRYKGYAKGISVGQTMISAALSGLQSSINLVISEKELDSLVKTGANASQSIEMTLGDNDETVAASLFYTDGTELDLQTMMSSADLTVSFTNDSGQPFDLINLEQTPSPNLGQITATSEGVQSIRLRVFKTSRPDIVKDVSWIVNIRSLCGDANGGKRYGLYCWYLTGSNESCDERCGTADSDFLSSGTMAHASKSDCSNIMKLLLPLAEAPVSDNDITVDFMTNAALGCTRETTIFSGGGTDRSFILFSSVPPAGDAKFPGVERTCACKER